MSIPQPRSLRQFFDLVAASCTLYPWRTKTFPPNHVQTTARPQVQRFAFAGPGRGPKPPKPPQPNNTRMPSQPWVVEGLSERMVVFFSGFFRCFFVFGPAQYMANTSLISGGAPGELEKRNSLHVVRWAYDMCVQ